MDVGWRLARPWQATRPILGRADATRHDNSHSTEYLHVKWPGASRRLRWATGRNTMVVYYLPLAALFETVRETSEARCKACPESRHGTGVAQARIRGRKPSRQSAFSSSYCIQSSPRCMDRPTSSYPPSLGCKMKGCEVLRDNSQPGESWPCT